MTATRKRGRPPVVPVDTVSVRLPRALWEQVAILAETAQPRVSTTAYLEHLVRTAVARARGDKPPEMQP